MAHFEDIKIVKVESCADFVEENDSKEMVNCAKSFPKIKEEYDMDCRSNFLENVSNSNESSVLEDLLIKPEVESEVEENYELSQSDIEKEFEAFNKEDEQKNSGKTILENNTTAYKCQICSDIFHKFLDYKSHKRNHFIEKRRFV